MMVLISQLKPGRGKSRGMEEVVGKSGMRKKYTEETGRGRFTGGKRGGNITDKVRDFSVAFKKLPVLQNKPCAFKNEL